MGRKVNPIGYRLAVQKDWRSKWYASEQDYTKFLHQDIKVRKWLKKTLYTAGLAKIEIERAFNAIRVKLHTSRPGIVIGRKGAEIENLSNKIAAMCDGQDVKIDIHEIKQPELVAQLVAESVAVQLERRIAFRRAMKRSIQTTMDFGADGIRIRCSGRLGGADIARAEWYKLGKVPLQTLRVPIDYGFAEAKTTYGIIGIKCWINKKEEIEKPKRETGGGPRRDPRGRRGRQTQQK